MNGPAPFWRLACFQSLPSTSDLCIERARQGEPEGLAVLAHSQSRGRGSHGRDWASPPGNLALSVLLRPPTPVFEAGQWSLLAGLATIEALASYATGLSLKWPNDILLNGAKLAGILIESAAAEHGAMDWLVIGIGVNLAQAPTLPHRATASLPTAPKPEPVANLILARLSHWMSILGGEGFAPIRAAWLACAHPVGTELDVLAEGQRRSGAFAGISPSGALMLDSGATRLTVSAADVNLTGAA